MNSEQIIRRAYDLAEKVDVRGWVECFTPDGTFTDMSVGVTYRSPTAPPACARRSTATPREQCSSRSSAFSRTSKQRSLVLRHSRNNEHDANGGFGMCELSRPRATVPTLSREREHELAVRWREHGDAAAGDLLIRSQMRHVVTIARQYRRAGSVTFDELVAEGNFGLVHALAKFDPNQGTRLVTYSVFWIRAYISQHLTRCRSLVTTGVQSKLLAKIRYERARIAAASSDHGDTDELVAARLAVSPEKMRSLVERLELRDTSWDAEVEDSRSNRLMEVVESLSLNPEDAALQAETKSQLALAVSQALPMLDPRERYVAEHRMMAHPEEQLSLAEIGRRFGVSRERARQIEARAKRKLRAALVRSGANAEWRVHPVAA
jgi:RNA polymerase sigma-32 factor